MREPILIFAQHHSITVHTLAQVDPGFCIGIKTVSSAIYIRRNDVNLWATFASSSNQNTPEVT